MKNKKYTLIERPDNIGRIIQGQSETGEKIPVPLIPTLAENYDYLLESLIQDRFFVDEKDEFAFIKEIVYENKVVGFSTWRYSNYAMILVLIYILPEYRGNNLLYDDLIDTSNVFSMPVAIDCPNQYVIKSLIKNDLARYINDYLVISDILLSFQIQELDDDLKKYAEEHENLVNPVGLITNSQIYDTNISAVVSLENEYLPNLISPPLDVDIRDFDAMQKRFSFNPKEYFKKIKEDLDEAIEK